MLQCSHFYTPFSKWVSAFSKTVKDYIRFYSSSTINGCLENASYFYFLDCNTPGDCSTCPGGAEFTGQCPTANICRQFRCTSDASCSNRGVCNVVTGMCNCRFNFVGKDCSLEPRKTFASRNLGIEVNRRCFLGQSWSHSQTWLKLWPSAKTQAEGRRLFWVLFTLFLVRLRWT